MNLMKNLIEELKKNDNKDETPLKLQDISSKEQVLKQAMDEVMR